MNKPQQMQQNKDFIYAVTSYCINERRRPIKSEDLLYLPIFRQKDAIAACGISKQNLSHWIKRKITPAADNPNFSLEEILFLTVAYHLTQNGLTPCAVKNLLSRVSQLYNARTIKINLSTETELIVDAYLLVSEALTKLNPKALEKIGAARIN